MNDADNEQQTTLVPDSYSSGGIESLLLRFHPDLTKEQIAQASGVHKERKAISALSRLGLIDEPLFLRYVASSLNIRLLNLRDPAECDRDKIAFLLMDLPPDFAIRNRAVPLLVTEDEVVAAFADPLDTDAIMQLQTLLQTRVYVCLASESDILEVLTHRSEGASEDGPTRSGLALEDDSVEFVNNEHVTRQVSESSLKSAPVVQLTNRIFSDAIAQECSDIHFEPSENGLEIKFRIDGVLSTKHTVDKDMQAHATSRIKLLAGMDITERRRPQDGRLTIKAGKRKAIDMRVSSLPTPAGEKLVIRLLSGNPGSKNLRTLGLPEDVQTRIQEILGGTDGIVLVTGPTGSGKTTTLYTCLYHVLSGSRHAVTVEDPIEFRIPGITQMQVDRKLNMTFSAGLRSILRQDPDVILLGEIRDIETASTAFHASQTGHLVMSTLHTNDAPSAVTRLHDMGLDPAVLASSLRVVLAQRLVRKVCNACSRPLTPYEMESAKAIIGKDADTSKMRIGSGCSHCNRTGLRGRIGVYSLLPVTGAVKAAVLQGAGEDALAEAARPFGYRSLQETGLALVLEGQTTLNEISRVLGTIQPDMRKVGEEGDLLTVSALRSRKKRSRKTRETGILNAGEVDLEDFSSESLLDLAHGQPQVRNKILLIDDDQKIRSIMAQALRGHDYEVTEAANGAEALRMLPNAGPTVIVCDLMMPELDGRGFVASLRSTAEFNHLPVLILTSEVEEGLETELREAGANDFVEKTSSIKTILSRVKKLIRDSHYPKMELTLE